ncbi:MAG TPA: hypothetical protein VFG36_03625 [Methanoregula sp.]|nr:hypothetical protein [Methanoregula sp.]
MAKRSKPSGKGESKIPIKEEAIIESVNEETTASGGDGQRFDFFYVLAGGGALIGVILIIFIILRYILHMV